MANNLSNSPIIIDTPGAGVLIPDLIRVKGIRWVGSTTGHTAIITDASDNVKWESIATGPVEADLIEDKNPWRGLKVPTLQSGRLYIDIW